jgi:pantoate--beta-alanine ligase
MLGAFTDGSGSAVLAQYHFSRSLRPRAVTERDGPAALSERAIGFQTVWYLRMRELERQRADKSIPARRRSSMATVRTVAQLRGALAPARREGKTIGLVPTMGAFHEGHLSLMRKARADCDVLVVSLFVNPTQFGEEEDFAAYPRDPVRDAALAADVGVDILFEPEAEEVYPPGFSTTVEVRGLSEVLCGAPARRGAGHFRGVATVVVKLLNMCQPDVAYFGAKDFQQSVVIKRLVRDLDIPVRIEVCPIVREPGGLALSSRNAYLSQLERRQAQSLKRALEVAEQAVRDGATRAEEVRGVALRELEASGVETEYVEVVSAEDLTPLDDLENREILVAIAAMVGRARLIDNVVVKGKARTRPAAAAAAS